MIEVIKGQDRIPCDANADLEKLVSTHGADGVLVDGVSVAEIAARAASEAAAEAEETEAKAAAEAPATSEDAGATVSGSVAQDPTNFNPAE